MVKKVAKRGWSLEKFTESVKAACERSGTKFNAAKVKKAYEDGLSVAATVGSFANARVPIAKKTAEKKAA